MEKIQKDYFDQMERLSPLHIKFLIIVAIAYFFNQMDTVMLGYVLPAIREQWNLSMEQVATIHSINFWGMCIGSLFGGWFSQRWGRKSGFLLSFTIFSLASVGNGLSMNVHMFQLFRFVMGFGAISMVVIAMVYIAEMMPAYGRGKYQALSLACGIMGVPIGSLFASFVVPISDESWRWAVILEGMGILILPIAIKWLRESPRWLALQGQINLAENIVQEYTGTKAVIMVGAQEASVSFLETIKIMFSKLYIRRTMVVLTVTLGTTLGYFYVQNWLVTFLIDAGWQMKMALLIVAIGSFGTPIGDFVLSVVTDKGGRKTPIICYFFINAIICLIMGISYNYVMLFLVIVFIRAITWEGSFSIAWTYVAESFPTKIRSSATGLIFAVARACTAIAMLTVPWIHMKGGFFGVNLFNSLLYLVPGIIVLLFGDATAGKSLEQLEQEQCG